MKKEQLLGLLFGGVVGDALGVPVEFLDRGAYPKVVDMQEFGTHHQPKGTWSDDTSMTLATMAALSESSQPQETMTNFAKWIYNADFTPFGQVFDVGMQTQKAVDHFHRLAIVPEEMDATDEFSNGNGALMRIMPISVLMTDDVKSNLQTITQFTVLTHPHPRSVLADIIYLLFIDELIQGKAPAEALRQVAVRMKDYINQSEALKVEQKAYQRLFSASFSQLPLDEIRSSGYVVDTLEAAIWILLNTYSFKEAVLMAVNMGDDTDTVAEVTGQLAGLLYGYDHIPHQWLEALQNQPLLNDIANRFIQKFVSE